MDEGVDPTQMCRSLVEKVGRSEQLKAVTEPEVLVLFEDWLEELEEEVLSLVRSKGSADPALLAEDLGVSGSGVRFLIKKLATEGKIPSRPGD